MRTARTEVARIYEAIGVHVIGVLEAPTDGDRGLYVRIVREKTADALKASWGVLGTTFSGGILAHVLYDRVERFARTTCNGLEATLGLTIAHEVGHLLLQNGEHALLRADARSMEHRRLPAGRVGPAAFYGRRGGRHPSAPGAPNALTRLPISEG